MEKVVVVTRDNELVFQGKHLTVINKSALVDVSSGHIVGSELLIIKDGQEQLAVFKEWEYWRIIK